MSDAKTYKARITEMLAKVPPGILSGSHQKVVQYKEAVEMAKAATKQNNLSALNTACSRLETFYK